jgi:hypothetical protein
MVFVQQKGHGRTGKGWKCICRTSLIVTELGYKMCYKAEMELHSRVTKNKRIMPNAWSEAITQHLANFRTHFSFRWTLT